MDQRKIRDRKKNPGSVHVGFLVEKVVLELVSPPPPPRVLRFSPVNFIPPMLHYTENWKKLIIFIGFTLSLKAAVRP
jgi:hypothetical protein